MGVKLAGIERAKLKIKNILNIINDASPVFIKFIKHYQGVLKDNFNRAGALFGETWAAYNPNYWAWKKKQKYPNMKKLVLTGAMFRASQGGSGWFQNIKKNSLSFGITNIIPYAALHQYGGEVQNGKSVWTIPARPWFFKRDNTIPNTSILFLERELKEELKKAVMNG